MKIDRKPLFESVVVPLDSTAHPERALHPAATLAAQADASLALVSVAPPWDVAERQDYLRMAAVGLEPYPDQAVLHHGPPAEVLVEDFQARGACLPCMTSHARGAIGQAYFGDVASEVVRALGRPVLVIGRHDRTEVPAYTEVVIAVDATRASTAIVPAAVQLAEQIDAKVQVVQVVEPDALERALAAGVPTQDLFEPGHVSQLARDLPDDVAASWDVLHHHDPARGIVEYVSDRPSAIVALMTHARSGLDLAAIGSVANHVVHSSPCPVLLLHSTT